MSQHESPITTITSLYTGIKVLLGLQVENLRLKTTEKITVLLSAIAFYAVAMAIGLVCLIFVSIALGKLLATQLAPYAAYLVIAGVYLLAFIFICALRRQIFIDPIARFMSRLLVELPEEEREINSSDNLTEPESHVRETDIDTLK